MNRTKNSVHRRGFTFIDLLVVIAVVAVLCYLLVPSVGNGTKRKGVRIRCLSNQKQTALAFLLWANDREQDLPMRVSSTNGGIGDGALKLNLVANYLVVSNELNSPGVLACPEDKRRKPAESFSNLTDKNLSYFLNVQASITNQEQILIGDRSITINGMARRGYAEATNGSTFAWTNGIHADSGNIALTDGSAHMANNRILNDVFRRDQERIRLLIP